MVADAVGFADVVGGAIDGVRWGWLRSCFFAILSFYSFIIVNALRESRIYRSAKPNEKRNQKKPTKTQNPLSPRTARMSPASYATPTTEDVEEVLLACRYGEPVTDLEEVMEFVRKFGSEALAAARDHRGNTVLHMSGGNGHPG